MRERRLHQELDGLVVKDMEMISIDACDAAMPMAHVFAQANVGDCDQIGTSRFDGAQRFLNDAVFCVRAAGLFVLLVRNPEKKDRLEPQILGAERLVGNLL